MFSRKIVSYGIIALAGVAAPFGLQMEDGRIRLSQACSQATDCEQREKYICSKASGDLMGYSCIAGCGS